MAKRDITTSRERNTTAQSFPAILRSGERGEIFDREARYLDDRNQTVVRHLDGGVRDEDAIAECLRRFGGGYSLAEGLWDAVTGQAIIRAAETEDRSSRRFFCHLIAQNHKTWYDESNERPDKQPVQRRIRLHAGKRNRVAFVSVPNLSQSRWKRHLHRRCGLQAVSFLPGIQTAEEGEVGTSAARPGGRSMRGMPRQDACPVSFSAPVTWCKVKMDSIRLLETTRMTVIHSVKMHDM